MESKSPDGLILRPGKEDVDSNSITRKRLGERGRQGSSQEGPQETRYWGRTSPERLINLKLLKRKRREGEERETMETGQGDG